MCVCVCVCKEEGLGTVDMVKGSQGHFICNT